MSKTCNGDIFIENQVEDIEAELLSDTIVGIPTDGTEPGFRGFEKFPLVAVPRVDITPYLKSEDSSSMSETSQDTELDNTKENSPQQGFSNNCTVNLIREDLEVLKDILMKNSASNKQSIAMGEDKMHLKCKICEKAYSSERKLQNHQRNKHMIVYKPQDKTPKKVSFSDHVVVHEVKVYHRCRKCPKIFEEYSCLKQHMKLDHKKRKCYICYYCSKKFIDRMFFKVHIKLHCDICGLLFQNKQKLTDHRQSVCRVLKKYKCKTCNDSYFRFMDLKDHSYDHIGTFYICDICKDQFQSKCAVSHHISFLHCKKRSRPKSLFAMRNLGAERLYLCNFCDDSSVEREVIENHVALLPDLTNRAMTGYKDFYFCDQCSMKFDTEMLMLQHKWTHFLKNNDNKDSSVLRSLLESRQMQKNIKMKYKLGDKIPEYMQPVVVLERLFIGGVQLTESGTVDVNFLRFQNKIVDPKSKKTLISRFQCEMCGKYLSSNYCLNRHMQKLHGVFEHYRCDVCEEMFVWASLLKNHNCIRMNIPEMPFDDARPEIQFDNLDDITANGLDDFNIGDSDDYMNSVDFEIPAPIVELTEYQNHILVDTSNGQYNVNVIDNVKSPLQNLGFKVVMQEVPIEF